MPLFLLILSLAILPNISWSQELAKCLDTNQRNDYSHCDFSNARFDGSLFKDASFEKANFEGSNFRGANFQKTNFINTIWADNREAQYQLDGTNDVFELTSEDLENLEKDKIPTEILDRLTDIAGQSGDRKYFSQLLQRTLSEKQIQIFGETIISIAYKGNQIEHITELQRTRLFIINVIRYTALGVAMLALILMVIRPMVQRLSDFPDLSFPFALERNSLSKLDFSKSSFKGTILKNTDFEEVNFSGADLESCDLKNSNLNRSILDSTNLKDANLTDAFLSKAKMQNIILKRANLSMANVSKSDLTNADLERADLFQASFEHSKLVNAKLKYANLANTTFMGANLKNADLTGAHLENTEFYQANLSGCIWTDGKPYSKIARLLNALRQKD